MPPRVAAQNKKKVLRRAAFASRSCLRFSKISYSIFTVHQGEERMNDTLDLSRATWLNEIPRKELIFRLGKWYLLFWTTGMVFGYGFWMWMALLAGWMTRTPVLQTLIIGFVVAALPVSVGALAFLHVFSSRFTSAPPFAKEKVFWFLYQ